MTPGARVQAAIEVLEAVLAGAPAERELTAWARGSRYAGSKDRAAVRDHVFDALRRLRSAAWAGGLGDVPPEAMQARPLMAGLLRTQGIDPEGLFTGQGHAPAALDALPEPGPAPEAIALDCPDWLLPLMRDALADTTGPILSALRDRAPVIMRANIARIDRDALRARLAAEGVETCPHPLSPSALEVEGPARGLAIKLSFLEGLFELQDAGSQALIDRLPDPRGQRILDLCAGGGGKALALAARGADDVTAHDIDPGRMRDLPARSARAGVHIAQTIEPEAEGPFDGVILDVPCTGSGSWRRAPEAKWRLTRDRLDELTALQSQILDRAVALTRPGGWLAYMTCSLLDSENDAQVAAALSRHPSLQEDLRWRCTPLDRADGFFLSVLRKV